MGVHNHAVLRIHDSERFPVEGGGGGIPYKSAGGNCRPIKGFNLWLMVHTT